MLKERLGQGLASISLEMWRLDRKQVCFFFRAGFSLVLCSLLHFFQPWFCLIGWVSSAEPMHSPAWSSLSFNSLPFLDYQRCYLQLWSGFAFGFGIHRDETRTQKSGSRVSQSRHTTHTHTPLYATLWKQQKRWMWSLPWDMHNFSAPLRLTTLGLWRAGDTDVRSVEVILEGLGSYMESSLELVSTQGLGCFQGAPSIPLITNWKDRINFHLLLFFISKCLWKGFNLICFCRQSGTSLLWTPDLIIRSEIYGTLIVLGW